MIAYYYSFIQLLIPYYYSLSKSNLLKIESNQVNCDEIKEWIQKNLKRNDITFEMNDKSFGIGSFSDKEQIDGYQIVSAELFSKYKNEFIRIYSNNNLTILKDFNCSNYYLNLSDSHLILNSNALGLYDSNETNICSKLIKKDTKVIIKNEGSKLIEKFFNKLLKL